MSWDALQVGERWPKCSHAKTPANTYRRADGTGICLECKRAYARDYAKGYNRAAAARQGRGQSVALRIEAGARGLAQLGINGITGDEFEKARDRTVRRLTRGLRR